MAGQEEVLKGCRLPSACSYPQASLPRWEEVLPQCLSSACSHPQALLLQFAAHDYLQGLQDLLLLVLAVHYVHGQDSAGFSLATVAALEPFAHVPVKAFGPCQPWGLWRVTPLLFLSLSWLTLTSCWIALHV